MLSSYFSNIRRMGFDQSSPVHSVSESRGGGLSVTNERTDGRKSSCLILDLLFLRRNWVLKDSVSHGGFWCCSYCTDVPMYAAPHLGTVGLFSPHNTASIRPHDWPSAPQATTQATVPVGLTVLARHMGEEIGKLQKVKQISWSVKEDFGNYAKYPPRRHGRLTISVQKKGSWCIFFFFQLASHYQVNYSV